MSINDICQGLPKYRTPGCCTDILGGTIKLSALPDGRTGAQITQCTDSDCNFATDGTCRWGADQQTDNHWFLASGQPDPTFWSTATGVSTMADEPFAIVPVTVGAPSDTLYSDPFPSQPDQEGTVTFDYWMV